MKRLIIISVIISLAIGLAVGIYDLINPIILDECGDWANPNMYDSSSEYWSAMIKDALVWTVGVAIVAFIVTFPLVAMCKKRKVRSNATNR